MRYKLQELEVAFRYGSLSTDDVNLTCLDIKEWYENQGGEITPETEIDFTKYFPGKPYEKTALTEKMSKNYLCEGSGSARIYQPDGRIDVISISVYRDTRGKQPIGDHYNLFLQYTMDGKSGHTDDIPNRHIPIKDGVIIKPFVNGEEIKKETAIVR